MITVIATDSTIEHTMVRLPAGCPEILRIEKKLTDRLRTKLDRELRTLVKNHNRFSVLDFWWQLKTQDILGELTAPAATDARLECFVFCFLIKVLMDNKELHWYLDPEANRFYRCEWTKGKWRPAKEILRSRFSSDVLKKKLETNYEEWKEHPTYIEYLASPEWRMRRVPALKRANGRCEDCGASQPLEVHHEHYDTLFEELPEDLRALCHECHKMADIARQERLR